MSEWVLLIIVSILVAFPDDTTILETKTAEMRYFESLESCEDNGKRNKDNIAFSTYRKAQSMGAVVKEFDIEHRCINKKEQAL